MLVQLVESSRLETMQHFSVFPLYLAVGPWVSNRRETELGVDVSPILHEGVAGELCAVVGDDPIGYTETANYSFEKFDCC